MTTQFIATVMAERGYEVLEGRATSVFGGAADSRLVQPGDLFAAFRGEALDGNKYLEQAVESGAVATISERQPTTRNPRCTYVIGPDSRQTVADLGSAWRDVCTATVVAITGTVGKTTAKELLAASLADTYKTHKSPGNFNSREGLPLALCSLTQNHEVSVLEMAMDSPGEITELCQIAKPDIGIVLNIGRTHVSKLGAVEAIAAEKLSLPRALTPEGTAILNADDKFVAAVAPELSCNVLTFGIETDAHIRATSVADNGLRGTSFDVAHAGHSAHIELSIPGTHVIPAALVAVATMLAMGSSLRESASAVTVAKAAGRMQVMESRFGFTILDDRYNASPASLGGALKMLGGLTGNRIALLGEMAELGDFAVQEHTAAGELAAANTNAIFAVGPLSKHLVAAARAAGLAEAHWFETKEEAAITTAKFATAGDHVLVKASRGHAFETILPLLGAEA